MKTFRIMKIAALILFAMLVFVTFQAYWLGQVDIPYVLKSLLVISGGMTMGYAASFLFSVWLKADNSF